jgi:hypothetical protein
VAPVQPAQLQGHDPASEVDATPQRPVPPLRGRSPDGANQPPAPTVPGRPAAHFTPGERAADLVLESLARSGEAPRVGLVGITGAGKTHAAKAFARGWLLRSQGIFVTVDAKANKRYDDLIESSRTAVRASVSDLRVRPLLPGTRHVIFRADPFRGVDVDPSEISAWCWAMAPRTPTCVLDDELVPFAARFGMWLGGDGGWVQRSFITGREHGLGRIWCTVSFAGVPVDASGQSVILAFKTAPSDVRLLRKRDYLIGVPDGLLENLPGPPLPYAERGVFVVLIPGVPWDGCLYKF